MEIRVILLILACILAIAFQNCGNIDMTVDQPDSTFLSSGESTEPGSVNHDDTPAPGDDSSPEPVEPTNPPPTSIGQLPKPNARTMTAQDGLALCAELDSLRNERAATPQRGAHIVGDEGVHFLNISALNTISEVDGDFYLFGSAANSFVNSITLSDGYFVFCNVHVNSIASFDGDLIVVNGSIGSISDLDGTLVLVNSPRPPVLSGINGVIKELTYQSNTTSGN